jgi:hypothetical protein
MNVIIVVRIAESAHKDHVRKRVANLVWPQGSAKGRKRCHEMAG